MIPFGVLVKTSCTQSLTCIILVIYIPNDLILFTDIPILYLC